MNNLIENKINSIKSKIIPSEYLNKYLYLKELIKKNKEINMLKNKILYYKDLDKDKYNSLKKIYEDNIYIIEFNNLNEYIKESLYQIKLIIDKELNINE